MTVIASEFDVLTSDNLEQELRTLELETPRGKKEWMFEAKKEWMFEAKRTWQFEDSKIWQLAA